MKFRSLLAASAATAVMSTGAFASTYDGPLTTIRWDVMAASPFPSTGTLNTPDGSGMITLTDVFGEGADIRFGKVLSAEVFDIQEEPGDDDQDDPTFTFVGEESGFQNDFELLFGETLVISVGEGYDVSDQKDLGGGLYEDDDIRFVTDGSSGQPANLGDPGFGIFWVEDNPIVLLAYSDRDADKDSDFNDLWVTVDQSSVNVVPLPAAGWMLLAGIGGLAALKRRKRA